MPMLLLTYPVIDPVLVHLGPLAIRWYALAYIGGLVAGWGLIRRVVADERYWGGAPRPTRREHRRSPGLLRAGRRDRRPARQRAVLRSRPIISPIRWKSSWCGTAAWRFTAACSARSSASCCSRAAIATPWLTVLDLACLVAPIGIFLGRIANFIKPELWGRPTDVPWAMVFPGSDGAAAPSEPALRGGAGGRSPISSRCGCSRAAAACGGRAS